MDRRQELGEWPRQSGGKHLHLLIGGENPASHLRNHSPSAGSQEGVDQLLTLLGGDDVGSPTHVNPER